MLGAIRSGEWLGGRAKGDATSPEIRCSTSRSGVTATKEVSERSWVGAKFGMRATACRKAREVGSSHAPDLGDLDRLDGSPSGHLINRASSPSPGLILVEMALHAGFGSLRGVLLHRSLKVELHKPSGAAWRAALVREE